MESTITSEQLQEARNTPVYSADDEQVGHIGEFWVDESGRPEWLKVGTGFLGMKNLFVPVQGGELRDDGFYAAYTKAQISDSPELKGDDFSPEYERELYGAYGVDRDRESRADSDADVTRHEEELQVGKQSVDAGRVRLRKYVETEPVETTVDLKRETARVTREQIDEPVDDADIGEDSVEVDLKEERPVVAKRAVAKERVGLEKDVETETKTVRDEVRKERIEVDGDKDNS